MLRVEVGSLTDTGRQRDHNEDSIAYHQPTDTPLVHNRGHLCVVADGLGGHNAGEVASNLAVKTVLYEYYHGKGSVERELRRAVQAANLEVYSHGQAPEHQGMETTMTAAVFQGASAHIVHVGDCRAYLLRANEIIQLTNDHSLVGEMLRMRLLNAEQARSHPDRNSINRSLGGDMIVRCDFHREVLQQDDLFVLCSDGLWSEVTDNEMKNIVQSSRPESACEQLVELANARGGPDNISVHVIKVSRVPEAVERRWWAFWKK